MSVKTALQMLPDGIEVFQIGQQAPGVGPFITGQPVKLWRGNIGLFKYLGKDEDAKPALLPHAALPDATTKLGSMDLNIPHIHHFVTLAVWRLTRPASGTLDPVGNLIGREKLFYQNEAGAVAAHVAADTGKPAKAIEAKDYRGQPFEFNYIDERKLWKISVGDGANNELWDLDDLWRQMTDGSLGGTNRGVGSPGKFDFVAGGLHWIPADADDGSTEKRYVPLPCRDLLPNEHVSLGTDLMNIGQVVVVADDGVGAPPNTGGGLTAQEHGWLESIYNVTR